MVRGLRKFSEYFTGMEGSYVLIGGAASHILEDEAQLVPRATKDLDIILIVEALSDEFVSKFWSFVKNAGYEHVQKGSGKAEFYRFRKPVDNTCPSQIELFSRVPDSISAPKDLSVTPIPTGEDLSSLSAIMMDDEYYRYTVENSDLVQGVHIARSQRCKSFGFDKPGYYEQVYGKDAGRLRKSNNWIAFIRGNHDNPAYFNEERIAYKRWRTIPDYSVISVCGHNILCVGGAVSIDREHRKKEQAKRALSQTGYYWPDEMPVFSRECFDSIQIPIDTIVTHTAPSFCEKQDHAFLYDWAQMDPTLIDDVAMERQTMDQIHDCIKKKGIPVQNWFYGHFHESWTSFIDGIRFKMLDIMEFYEVW